LLQRVLRRKAARALFSREINIEHIGSAHDAVQLELQKAAEC
jgi:hypothetical protein